MQELARGLPLSGEDQEVSLGFLLLSSASVVLMATLYARGIPAGYVSALERRLAETERALFFALAEIHDGVGTAQEDYETPSNATATTQQEKTHLLESWADSPLSNREQARSWFESKRPNALQNTSPRPRPNCQREPLDNLEAGIAAGPATGVVPAGRASSFAEANKRLYF